MAQFGVAVGNRTAGDFRKLYQDIEGDSTLAVPKDHIFFAFLDIIRQCKINTDNVMASMPEGCGGGLQIRLNQRKLSQIPDQKLKHLLAFNFFAHLECAKDVEWIDESDLLSIDEESAAMTVNTIVFEHIPEESENEQG